MSNDVDNSIAYLQLLLSKLGLKSTLFVDRLPPLEGCIQELQVEDLYKQVAEFKIRIKYES